MGNSCGKVYAVDLLLKQLLRSSVIQNLSGQVVDLISKVENIISILIFYSFTSRDETTQNSIVALISLSQMINTDKKKYRYSFNLDLRKVSKFRSVFAGKVFEYYIIFAAELINQS